TFGSARQKVTAVIANDDPGLDLDGFCLAVELFREIVASRLGVTPRWEDIQVVNVHVHRDHRNARLDVKAATVAEMRHILIRWYQKDETTVREEYQPLTELSASALAAAMSSGLAASQSVQLGYLVLKELQEFKELVGRFLEANAVTVRLLRALVERLGGGR
ncbi:MAG: hypothetical protein DRO06_03145, partial [Thermoproteota archaeon]